MKPILNVAILLACLALPARAEAIGQDSAKAIEAVEAAGGSLKRDKGGHVAEVSFRGTKIDDAPLAHLAGFPKLRSVLLNDTKITDAGLATLGKLTTLNNLDLRGCQVSNAGIAHLTGLGKLRALRLNGKNGATTVDDGAMVHIAKLKSLKALLLDFLFVSGEGLANWFLRRISG